MVEGDEFIGIDIRIGFLFKREVDIDTYGLTISPLCTFICCLHNTGSATRNYPVSVLRKLKSNFLRQPVIFIVIMCTRRSENRNTRADTGKLFKSFNKLRNYFKNTPRIGCMNFLPGLFCKGIPDQISWFIVFAICYSLRDSNIIKLLRYKLRFKVYACIAVGATDHLFGCT